MSFISFMFAFFLAVSADLFLMVGKDGTKYGSVGWEF